ncbi:MAG: hypothetical protein K940chlam7_00047 [Chlamydiae bacterium]|nr:hypothetical protein [Chlamydiota bacterium]
MQHHPTPQFTQNKPKLPFYERLAACLIVSFTVALIVMNFYLDEGKLPDVESPVHNTNQSLIQITIEGAVKNPGLYQVEKGTLVQDALQLAQPKEEANLKQIKLDSKVVRRRTIKVPSKK